MLSELRIVISANDTIYGHHLYTTFNNMGFDVFISESDPVLIEISIVNNEPDAVIINIDNMDYSDIEMLSKHSQSLDKIPNLFALYTYESTDIERVKRCNNMTCIEMPADFSFLCNEIMRIHSMSKISLSDVHSEIREKIIEILNLLNVPKNMFGYSYLREALFIAACSDKGRLNFSKEVYPVLSAKYSSNPACIERAIRVAINKAWSMLSQHIKCLFFDMDSLKNPDKPTNNEFIITLGHYIREEYRYFLEKAEKDVDHMY